MKTEGETREARNKDGKRAPRRRAWPAQVREAVVRAVIDQGLTTFAVARKLGVPYTTAVMWVKAYRERGEEALIVKKPALRRDLKKPPDERTKAILAAQRQMPHSGSRRIRDVMRRFFGVGTSETTVRRVLKAEGIKAQVSPKRVRHKEVVQHFERAEPNQLLQSDLFTFLLDTCTGKTADVLSDYCNRTSRKKLARHTSKMQPSPRLNAISVDRSMLKILPGMRSAIRAFPPSVAM